MKRRILADGISLAEIATTIGSELTAADGRAIVGLCPVDQGEDGCIAFSAETSTRRLLETLKDSPIAALIVKPAIDTAQLPKAIRYFVVEDSLRAFISLVPLFYQPYQNSNAISPRAAVAASAQIGKGVSIGDFVSIGEGCIIGDNVTIYPNVVVYPEVKIGPGVTIHAGAIIRERCELGADVIIQNGAVVGADGFGYIPDAQQGVRAVPQVGTVALAPRVEVGANSCIDRGAFGKTQIGLATKVDNLVQIGHNVRIGQFSFVCGQVAIAGSAVLGNQVTIGGNTGVSGHLTIADKVRVAGNSGVTSSLDKSGDYGGFPAQPAAAWRRQVAALRRLPERMALLRSTKAGKNDQDSSD